MKIKRGWVASIIVLLFISIIIAIAIYVFTSDSHQPLIEHNTYDYRKFGVVGFVIINVTWINTPAPNVSIELQDKDFNSLFATKTDEDGLAVVVLSNQKNGTYYLKVIYTAHFTEGGDETRYIWAIFNYNSQSDDTLNVNMDFYPTIWEEEPSNLAGVTLGG